MTSAFERIHAHFPTAQYTLKIAVFNSAITAWKSFLDTTPEEVQSVIDGNITTAFEFSRQAILVMKENPIDETTGKRGSLIFTGAGSAVNANPTHTAFSVAKHGLRSLSESLAKEFGKQNIHVSRFFLAESNHCRSYPLTGIPCKYINPLR